MAPETGGGRRQRLRREAWGFAAGSLCFLVGAVPFYAEWAGPVVVGWTFFGGSILFTLAAFIQLSLSGRHLPRKGTGRADAADWWASAIQFVGTLFFNVSTFGALLAAIADPTRLGVGWRPDAWGSIAFLLSSALALVATKDRGQLWDTQARTWRATWLNMFGSVFFGFSAIGAYVLPDTGTFYNLLWANLGTFLGAVCFLIAALLSRRTIGADEPAAAPGPVAA
ncbi:hypothetical protein [Agromyces binzhouensis]|uniref:hypothetical protein n=1 Tax=Agromyces binzhouensis TaxID=1817495 RepID=UPI003634FDDD